MKKSTFKFLAIAMLALLGTSVFAQTTYEITFNVDMTEADPFDPSTDEVYMSGSFAGWAQPGTDVTYKMEPLEAGSMIYTLTATIDSGEVQYKYFRVIDGVASWDNGEWTGDPNRYYYTSEDITLENVWGNQLMSVKFTVDMTEADPFNPETDEVYMAGSLFPGASWVEPGILESYKMNPVSDDSAMFYRLECYLYPGNYEFKYFRVINGEHSWNNGEWEGGDNRVLAVGSTALKIDNIWAEISSIFTQPNEFTYSMYPNPVVTMLNINNTNDVSKVNIYDVNGRLVQTMDVFAQQNITLNVAELQTGVYFVNVYNKTGVQTAKFVKN